MLIKAPSKLSRLLVLIACIRPEADIKNLPMVRLLLPNIVDAALDGLGLAFQPADLVQEHIKAGRLISVLEDGCAKRFGCHRYYPNRKTSAAFALVIERCDTRDSGVACKMFQRFLGAHKRVL